MDVRFLKPTRREKERRKGAYRLCLEDQAQAPNKQG